MKSSIGGHPGAIFLSKYEVVGSCIPVVVRNDYKSYFSSKWLAESKIPLSALVTVNGSLSTTSISMISKLSSC